MKEMNYNAHLTNRTRLRAISGTPAAIPPLPVTPPSTTNDADTGFESVLDNIVILPSRIHTLGHLVDIRMLDAGRLNWKPITEILGWQPGDRLTVLWSGEWMVLSPAADDDYSRIEVDDRGRIGIEAGLRARLSIEAGDRVVVRIRPGAGALEISNQAILAVALTGFDGATAAPENGDRSTRAHRVFSQTMKEADNG